MSLVSTASAVRVDKKCLRGVLVAVILLILAVVLVSCGGNLRLPAFGSAHNAYITLPTEGSVALLHIDGLSGVISLVARTPQVNGTSPSGLALMNKFLFVANSQANTISTFSVAGDGTLSAIGDAVPTGVTPAKVDNPCAPALPPQSSRENSKAGKNQAPAQRVGGEGSELAAV